MISDVNITINNGALAGAATATADGISGLILTGVSVTGASNVSTNTPYQLFKLADAEAKGVTETGSNAFAWEQISAFYDMAPVGTELWIMLVAPTVTMEDMLDKDLEFGPVLLRAAQGTIRDLGVSKKVAAGVVIAHGLDEDVDKAMIKGQALRTAFLAEMAPFRFVVDGKNWTGVVGDLKDYNTASFNGGGVLLGATSDSKNACVGLTIGAIAALPVQRKISRVKNGALPVASGSAYFTDGSQIETRTAEYNAISNKGYIFLIVRKNKSGYFFSGDRTATSTADDYSSLSRGRVIDKALVLTYATFTEEVDDEVESTDGGLIHPAAAKSLQGVIENTINLQMVQKGEASDVVCYIDPAQNVVTTGNLNISLGVRPKGYKSQLNIGLNFTL